MTYSLMFFGLASLLCATQSLLMPNPSALFQQSLNGFKTELGEFLAESPVYRDIVVVGSGPAGLATAIMLAKHNRTKGKIKLFDQLDEPPRLDDTVSWNVENKFERSYIIGLSGRGQKVLGDLGCIERIKEYSISLSGAKVWEPGTPEDAPKERVFTDRAYTTVCIERDRLSSCLVAELREKYNNTVDLRFNVKAKELHVHTDSGGSEFVEVEFEDTSSSSSSPYSTSTDTPKTFKEYSSLVIGADGANSAVRDALVDIKKESGMNFHVKTFEDKNVRVYRTIPLYLPNNTKANGIWNKTWSYSARTKSDINLEALPCFGPAQLGVVLFRPWDTRYTLILTLICTLILTLIHYTYPHPITHPITHPLTHPITQTINKIVSNILENPTNAKYFHINIRNEHFHDKVGRIDNSLGVLLGLGFREDESGSLVLPIDANLHELAARKLELEIGQDLIRHRLDAQVHREAVSLQHAQEKAEAEAKKKHVVERNSTTTRETPIGTGTGTGTSTSLASSMKKNSTAKGITKGTIEGTIEGTTKSTTHGGTTGGKAGLNPQALLVVQEEKRKRISAEAALNHQKGVMTDLHAQVGEPWFLFISYIYIYIYKSHTIYHI